MRCPGKVLCQVGDKAILGHLLQRLYAVPSLDVVAVATSVEKSDDAIADYCRREGVKCIRGELGDVAARLMGAAAALELDAFARICGDSPLLDPDLVHTAVCMFREHTPDLVTNCLPKKYPPGQSVEIVAMPAFRRSYCRFKKKEHFEHVTKYFYENPSCFSICCMTTESDYEGIHLAVDTKDDLANMVILMKGAAGESILSVQELAEIYRSTIVATGGDGL